jgi:hypothetical protein
MHMILFAPSQAHFFRYSFSLLFIMIIMLFFITTPVYVGQKNLFGSAYASSNATSGTDPALVFFLTNPTGNFNATGSISSLIVSSRTADPQYVLA